VQQFGHALGICSPAARWCTRSGSAMIAADGHARMQARIRVLLNELHVPAHGPQLRATHAGQIPAEQRTDPQSTGCSCRIARPVVVLPEPDSSDQPSVSPGRMKNDTPVHRAHRPLATPRRNTTVRS
jgi:hypothetical protein